jgi:hypothetical protein
LSLITSAHNLVIKVKGSALIFQVICWWNIALKIELILCSVWINELVKKCNVEEVYSPSKKEE